MFSIHVDKEKKEDIIKNQKLIKAKLNAYSSRKKKKKKPEFINFAVGNPNVEEIFGKIRLYKDSSQSPSQSSQLISISSSSSDISYLPQERNIILCILAVPSYFTINYLCNFLEPFTKNIKKIRLLRDCLPNKYMVLLKIDNQKNSDNIFLAFNGKRFTEIDPEVCKIVFVKDVSVNDKESKKSPKQKSNVKVGVGGYKKSPLSMVNKYPQNYFFESTMNIELPTCPVCLERLDPEVSGVITTLCNHEFHSSCLKKWGDSSCPVCRYSGDEVPAFCAKCGVDKDLWTCLTCGTCGCGRYMEGHARDHYKETGHCYSMEISSERVWDYIGDNYVHRLVENKEDGKLVQVGGSDKEMVEETVKLKQSEMEVEYNKLLTTVLTNQRMYFEHKIRNIESESAKEIGLLKNQIKTQGINFQKKEKIISKEIQFLNQMNKNLTDNQGKYKSKLNQQRKQFDLSLKEKQKKIMDLEEQVKDLMLHFQFQSKIMNEKNCKELENASISKIKYNKSNKQNKNKQKKKKN